MSFFIVGITKTCERLAVCISERQASEYIGTLPNAPDGIYYIDGPCTEPVILREMGEEFVWLNAEDNGVAAGPFSTAYEARMGTPGEAGARLVRADKATGEILEALS